jgi:hypothetical protein
MTENQLIAAETAVFSITPYAFCHYSQQLMNCYDLISRDKKFSPISYYFCCRAIELSLKSALLDKYSKSEIKKKYSHDLETAYLEVKDMFELDSAECSTLTSVNKLYVSKEFEYLEVASILGGYKGFPSLDLVHHLAVKIFSIAAERVGLKRS